MTSTRLQDKVAIVTGGASGFGKGIAAKFASEGAKVVIADVAEDAGQAVANQVQGLFVKTDVTKQADWERLLAESLRVYGKVDIVVNNAGTSYMNKPSEAVTEHDFDLVIRVNLKSVYMSTAVLLPYFFAQEHKGCFIQIASTGGVRPRPGLTWYNATKAAVINATRTLAIEYGPKQIRFNAVSPSVGITPITNIFLGKPATEEALAPFLATIPLGRASQPSDVANACCYLASDEAAYITGVNLEVDGGRCA
ncbi:hypothetical protein CDD82_7817 [Ophiocordyceps australis]|uniref:Uncharacterized protein n=1 Tax=Ophiocordyceps australis TaxID=1399860 RepID=A0A2C5YIL6_9HYPO|nr:hypothetical protein CDD82_7817 [Ophiocordyceps australis]